MQRVKGRQGESVCPDMPMPLANHNHSKVDDYPSAHEMSISMLNRNLKMPSQTLLPQRYVLYAKPYAFCGVH
jgi:hypothetical protein